VLLGVTGSGKTFTMAKVIEELQRPALMLAPNKILAAQLYGEFKSFFPDNAVEYFVSYYDYYQPEAYVPRSDTYIEKESSTKRGDRPDAPRGDPVAARTRRRHHRRVGVVPIRYRLGRDLFGDDLRPEEGQTVDQREIVRKLVALQYKRNDAAFQRGNFRVKGDTLEIFPEHYEDSRVADQLLRRRHRGDHRVRSADRQESRVAQQYVRVYANSHYVTPGPTMKQATEAIRTS
jgi:excinuclease ABC subunit B